MKNISMPNRPVLAKVWDAEKKDWDAFVGIFHQWGNSLLESRDGDHAYTVAIVERENGKIETVAPEHVCFMD